MTDRLFVPAADRNEMIRAFIGLVTAKVAQDPDAMNQQMKAIVRDQLEASQGDIEVFAGRMSKQVEAGAVVAFQMVKLLARRLNASEEATLRVIAETWSSQDAVTD